MLPPIRYSLCFLTRPGQVLMLRRRYPPNQGLWNGVGGRIEAGETPMANCLREVEEETGYRLESARFAGLLTWEGFETPTGGLALFTAEAPAGECRANAEGELRWQPVEWACSHPQVVGNLHIVLPHVLSGGAPRVDHFVYQDGEILRHDVHPLPPVFHYDRKA
jgi:8-oxo-dGTP diphosphatase